MLRGSYEETAPVEFSLTSTSTENDRTGIPQRRAAVAYAYNERAVGYSAAVFCIREELYLLYSL